MIGPFVLDGTLGTPLEFSTKYLFTKRPVSFYIVSRRTESPLAGNQPTQDWKPKYNPWLIAVVVALAAFMEVLDTSIANVALRHIAGALGASQEESTWVLTTYLVANAIVLPITGWLSSLIGRKRFFMLCVVLFTASSVLCGIATTLPILLFARAIQGAGGGGLQPMSQAIMADVFPPEKRGMAFALFGVTVVVAPALGPILGGWITDNYSWRWIFLINVPVGMLALALVHQVVQDPPFLRRFKLGEARFDYVGFAALALGVAALQTLLDKGQEEDWLNSHFIAALAVIAVVALSFLILWEWYEKKPIVDVQLFRFVNFSTAAATLFSSGIVMFSSTVLMPQFLQALMGYTAETSGLVVSAGAALLLITMPIVGVLTSRLPLKYLMAFGWLLSAGGMYLSAKLVSLEISFAIAAVIMLVQYAPLGFIFIPSTTAAYVGIPQDRTDSVSGISNFMRNIGMSVGTSLSQTVIARRQQFHISRLASHTGIGNLNFTDQLQGMASALHSQSAGVGAADAQTSALAQRYQSVMGQASALSYIDAYFILGVGSAAMLLFSFLLQSNDPKHTEQHAGH
jgi:DHA2 family multidrug resistance protein